MTDKTIGAVSENKLKMVLDAGSDDEYGPEKSGILDILESSRCCAALRREDMIYLKFTLLLFLLTRGIHKEIFGELYIFLKNICRDKFNGICHYCPK